MTTKKASGESPNFEKSMERLEAIVGDMEGGALSLDTMIQRFEEGQSLIKFCTGKLDEVERKIEKLLSTEGAVETEPFGDDAPSVDLSDDSSEEGELLF
jgi:exodeoxyribonuclease VII small subunit